MSGSTSKWTSEEQAVVELVQSMPLPKHIAIIMDGNGRWAKNQKLSRIKGHFRGAEVVKNIVRACHRLGIEYLTVYAFSQENWSRPTLEINALMKLLRVYLISERKELMTNNIRLTTIGNRDLLPKSARKSLDKTMELTKDNSDMVFTIALSYSGRDEIVRAVRKMVDQKVASENIDADVIESALDTATYPDPDLLIRTSGEMRISNFMLWQLAYTELYVTDTLWPDFNPMELLNAIRVFQGRKRRYGGVDDHVGPSPTTLPGGNQDA